MQDKKIALVSGASRGIGRETARLLVDAGYRVYGLARGAGAQDDPYRLVGDVSDAEQVQAALRRILEREGRLDLLVCNAGFGISGPVEFTEPEQARRQFAVNFFGAFACVKSALPALKQSEGRIIMVSSVAGVLPVPFQAFYSASKAALNALALALADEVRPFGVQVCAALPGDTRTGFTAAREKARASTDDYGAVAENSLRRMEQDEQNGMSAAYVARKLVRIAQKRRVRPFYIIGPAYRAFYILQKFLPLRLVRFIVRNLYAR